MLPIWKNLGFILYIVLYFNLTDSIWNWPKANTSTLIFKVLPIFHILLTIISTVMEFRLRRSKAAAAYQWIITAGLVTSVLGEVANVYKNDKPLYSIILYGISHLLYTVGFGFRPIGNGPTAVTFFIMAVFGHAFLSDGLNDEDLVIRTSVTIYSSILCIMAWRATVRFISRWSAASALAAVGAILFLASDFMLALERWHGKFSRSPMWIMLTYYVAQLCIGLSACDHEDFDDYYDYARPKVNDSLRSRPISKPMPTPEKIVDSLKLD